MSSVFIVFERVSFVYISFPWRWRSALEFNLPVQALAQQSAVVWDFKAIKPTGRALEPSIYFCLFGHILRPSSYFSKPEAEEAQPTQPCWQI